MGILTALFVVPSSARAQLIMIESFEKTTAAVSTRVPQLNSAGSLVHHAAEPKRKRGAEPNVEAERRAVDEARRLAGSPPSFEIVIIDPEFAADPDAIRRLDAFTVRESTGALRPKIFINSESGILRQAARGEEFYVAVLAAVLVHEIEHLKGGSESAAREAERRFFEDLMARGVVSEGDGLRYAAMLRGRRADTDTHR